MLKKKLLAVAVVGAFALPGAVLAAEAASPHTITGNLNFVSDYSFRGLSQTLEEPAIQGGFDYAHSSGLYLGTWGSNVSQSLYGPANMEWDFYGGWAKTFGDFGVNVGALLYYYPGGEPAPGEKYDTTEIYAGGSWKWISAKLSYAVSDFFGGNQTTFPASFSDGSDGSMYIELNATYPINDAFSISAHIGQQTVEGTAPDAHDDRAVALHRDAKACDDEPVADRWRHAPLAEGAWRKARRRRRGKLDESQVGGVRAR